MIWIVDKNKYLDVQISVLMIEIVRVEVEVDQIKQVKIYLFRIIAYWTETNFFSRRKSLIRFQRNIKREKKIRCP